MAIRNSHPIDDPGQSRSFRAGALSHWISMAGFILVAAAWAGSARADTVAGTLTWCTDTRPSFDAAGTLTTTDALNDGLNGPSYLVRDFAAPYHWQFNIKHMTTAPHWNADGAVGVQVCIDGSHNDGPHPNDVDPNGLAAACSKAVNVKFGVDGTIKVSKYNRVAHPAGHDGNHFDHYGIKAVLTAIGAYGGGNQLTGAYEVHGRHTGTSSRPDSFDGYAMAASASGGTYVYYDARLGLPSDPGRRRAPDSFGFILPGSGRTELLVLGRSR